MVKRPRKKPKDDEPEREKGQPYGFVLILRAIASFAIRWPEKGAALRVLCVMADYMDQDGVCRVGQNAIADRLGVSRIAVNKQLTFLNTSETLISTSGDLLEPGKTKRYILDFEHVKDQREGQFNVDIGRATRRAERRKDFEQAPAESGRPKPEAATFTPPAPPPRSSTPRIDGFAVGDRAFHPRFGTGLVVDVDGQKVKVSFETGKPPKVVIESFLQRMN